MMSATYFCSRDEFRGFLRRIGSISFTVKANRESIREEIMSLGKANIFSRLKRFPEGVWFPLESHKIRDAMFTIRASLDSFDRHVENTGTGFDQRGHADAKKSFDSNLRELSRIASICNIAELTTYGVVTRTTFEATNNLVWA